ncbi:MAG: DNA glycosylase [Actinomycetota bacterium]|nr:DNA glycosylase [Actinomycetota bacterium]
MPEGDTVFRAAAQLRGALAGRVLTRSDFRVPRYATADLSGQEVTEVVARGKHLLARTDAGLTVHTHLKMEGRWRVQAATERLGNNFRIRLVLANTQWLAIGYDLGQVELLRTDREDQVTGHLGPDLLGPDWDAGEAVRRLRADPDRAVGEALLDQRNLAGIGNVFAAEILFLGGVHPWRPAGAVKDVDALVDLSHRLLQANKNRTRRITTGVDSPGQHVWVYGREAKPCRRCGTRIRKGEQGPAGQERIRYWCPQCQQ